jgi:hypothetical protein
MLAEKSPSNKEKETKKDKEHEERMGGLTK